MEVEEKVQILKVEEEKMTELQRQLVHANNVGEHKDLEIYRKGDQIRYRQALQNNKTIQTG